MRQKLCSGIIIGGIVSLFLIVCLFLSLFSGWQNRLSDLLFLSRTPNPDVVIIAIDNKSIQSIGRWPWTRDIHAQLLSKLGKSPQAIGIDVTFSEPSAEDESLAKAIQQTNRVVLASETSLLPVDVLRNTAEWGKADLTADADGIVRKAMISGSFAGVIANKEKEGTVIINFSGPPGHFTTYSYVDVLLGTVSETTLKGKIVLIGATASDLHDEILTPVSAGKPMSGVEVHANILQTLLTEKFLYAETKTATALSLVILAITTASAVLLLNPAKGTIVGICLFILYILWACVSFDRGMIRNLLYPPIAIMLSIGTGIGYQYFFENRQKRFIQKALGCYLSKDVMKDILSNPKKLKLGGEKYMTTILFSDIAGFTSISEKLPPEELSKQLNRYLTKMTNLVFLHNGVLDKYIGDAVMAFWGAPVKIEDHALQACTAALEMQKAVVELGLAGWSARIGINTGDAVVGNMGSDMRFDYTALGDNVNLASRLEGINKEYGTRIMISESTWKQVNNHIITRNVDTVAVKGKEHGVRLFELRGIGQANANERQFLHEFERARALYESGTWKQAKKAFETFLKTYPSDGPARALLARCTKLLAHPPAHWDGVFHATSK